MTRFQFQTDVLSESYPFIHNVTKHKKDDFNNSFFVVFVSFYTKKKVCKLFTTAILVVTRVIRHLVGMLTHHHVVLTLVK